MTTATGLKIVEAREEHIPFIAWVELAAARSQLEQSFMDIYIGGTDEECLRYIETLAATEARHFGHYTNFIVAEVDGRPAAALSGYFAEEFGLPAYVAGIQEANRLLSRTAEEQKAGWQRSTERIKAFDLCKSERVPGAWIVEWVAARPEYQRRGLINALLSAILDVGRGKGASTAEISVLIGNDRAQRAYEKAGFSVVDEQRHPEFEAVVGCPGIRLLRRAI